MAVIRDFAVTEWGSSTLASIDCEMPIHEANDILIYFASKDGAPVINDPGGIWTNIQDGATAGAAYRCGWALATGSTHTLTLVTGTAENWTVVVLAIDGAHTTSPINISAESAGDDTAMPFDGPSTTTTSGSNHLILHAWFSDSGLAPTAYAPLVNLFSGDNGANSTAVAYTFKPSTGAIAAASWYGLTNDDGRGVVVVVNDDGTGTQIPPYSDSGISSGQVLRPVVGLATAFSDSWPTSVTITALGQNFEANSVYVYEVLPSYTDDTTDANDPGTADVTWPMHIGDMMYFGHSSKFATLAFITSQAGVTGVVVWEYWNGAWTTAPGMTGAFTATGGARVAFTREIAPTNWVTNDPGMGQTKYWVRCRITTAYTTAVIQSQIRLNGYVAAYIVSTAAADAGTNPYCNACQCAGAASQSNLAGPQCNFGSALDMDTGIIVGTVISVLPSNFAKDIALPTKTPGGVQITFFDTSNNCLSYIVGAKGCKSLNYRDANVYAIDWNGSATPWATCGTINKSAVTSVFFSTLGYVLAAAHRWSMLSLVTRIGIAGGTSTYPLDFDDLDWVLNHCMGWFPFFKRTGSAATLYTPLQIGGGDPVRIEVDLKTFQFPHVYDGVDYFDWNAAVDVAGIKFYPQSGDVIAFTNTVFTSESSYRWEFDSSSSSGATVDFAGSTVIGAKVGLDNEITLDGVIFSICKEISAAGTLANCTFKSTVGAAALQIDSPSAMSAVTDCTFSDNTTYALRMTATSAQSYTLSGITFSNNTTDVYFAATTGTATLNVYSGSTPTTGSAGCVVAVNNLKTLTLTNLIADSEVRIYTAGTTTELDGIENCSTTFNFSYNYVASTYVDIVIHKADYIHYRVEDYLLGSSDASLPIQQQVDRQYSNP
jgi:hypothetical protein